MSILAITPARVPHARAALAIALLSVTVAAPVRAQGATWSGIAPGPFAVGYRTMSLVDSTRTLLPDTLAPRAPMPRTIPLRIWYPAAGNARAARAGVTVGEIIDRRGSAVDSALAGRTRGLHRWLAQRYDRAGGAPLVAADTAGLQPIASSVRTIARVGLAPAGGRHPLVVFAGGTAHGIDENVALWEHLASFGYVVAVIATIATTQGAEDAYQPADAAGLETATRDLEVVLARMLASPGVDRERVAAAGFSFGGAGAMLLAARNARVRAVVGLDASFIAGQHLAKIRANPLFDARRLDVPVLELHRADTATVDMSLVEGAARSARTSIEVAGLDHVDFNSYVLLYAPLLQARGARAQRDSALAFKAAAYRAMVRTTRVFFDNALGRPVAAGEADAVEARGPAWAEVPAATVRVRRWPAAR